MASPAPGRTFAAMTPHPIPTPPRRRAFGGTGFFLVVSIATIVTVALESAFISAATWALLPAIVLTLIVAAFCVIAAVGRLLEDDDSDG